MHATHTTPRPHGARRTAHGARRTAHTSPRLALWQIVLEERCLGQTTCMFVVNDELFGGDPCVGKQKRYAGYRPVHSTLETTLSLAHFCMCMSNHVHCMGRLGARLACGDHLAAEMAAKAAKGKRCAHPHPRPHPCPHPRLHPYPHPYPHAHLN